MYIVTEKDLIGDIEGFPIEVVQKMIERQFEQHGRCDVKSFQDNCRGGVEWRDTPERYHFWFKVIRFKNFDLFFEKYPKKKEELPLPRKVLVWGDDESRAEEMELIYILPDNLGLDYRFAVKHPRRVGDALLCKNMKELPPAKKMTKEEIEQELGYKIEIV